MATPRELGYNFISQSPYLQNDFVPNEITFNESPDINTGIFGPGISPFPIIPMYGDSDGGDGSIGIDTGEITSDVGFGNLDDQTGMGYTLTEEDKAAIALQKNKNRLSKAAQLGMFALNPVGYTLRQISKPYTDPFVNKIKDKLTGGGGDGPGPDINPGTFTAQSLSDSFSGEEGPSGGGGGNMSASDFSDDSPGTPFQYGGRAGYRSGKLVEGIMSFFKPKRAIDYVGFRSRKDIPLEQYSKMEAPITTKMMEEIPESELKKIFRTQELGLYSETPEILKAGNLMQRFTKKVGGKRVIDYERAEDILNVRLRGDETLDELFEIEFRTRPVERAYGGIVGMYR
jgi:hypothetical protein